MSKTITTRPSLEARPAGIDTVKNIVLVHGASNDGSAWRGAYAILRKDGFHVSVVQEPLTDISQPSPVANVIEAAARSVSARSTKTP